MLLNLSTLCSREGKWDQLLAVQGQEVRAATSPHPHPQATNMLCACGLQTHTHTHTHLHSLQGDVLRGAAVLEMMLAQYQVVASVVSSSTAPNELWAQLRVVVREGQPLDSPSRANSSRFCLFLRCGRSTEGTALSRRGQDPSVAAQESRARLMAEVRSSAPSHCAWVCACVRGCVRVCVCTVALPHSFCHPVNYCLCMHVLPH